MILPDKPRQQQQNSSSSSELRMLADMLGRLLEREVNVKVAVPEIKPILQERAPITKWRFEIERDYQDKIKTVIATAVEE